jgi:hypothetical protein
MPGGGANKTVLGIYRMGEDDGTSSASAIIGNPGDIFPPIEAPDRVNPERTFANVGNNVFQPQNDDLATHALLKRLGEQKFKAESQAPFEEYRAQQRLARDLEEVSRNASLSDLGTSRELIRNMAAERRQQNEDDYLRKMLDAGATPEAAKKEIEDVRNANAIQEARKIEDRGYQAKMLIQRLAMSRGVTPMVQEPLNQSSSIDNPQRSQAMSQAMGMPGEGFGTSPLDMNRQFLTPAFYKKFLRRSAVSQEASDEASAFGQLITGSGDADMIPPPSQGSFSMATLKGQERQQQIEMASEALASRLDAMRQRGLRIKKALPFPAVGKTILEALYKQKTKSVGSKVIFTPETIEDLAPLQLLMSINMNALSDKNGFNKLTKEVMKYTWKTGDLPAPRLTEHLRKVAYAMNNNEQDIRIPYASAVLPTSVANPTIYAELFQNIKNGAVPNLSNEISRGRRLFIEAESSDLRATDFEELPDIGGGATTAINAVPIPGAPNTTNVRTTNAIRQLQRAVRSRQRTAVTDVMGGIMNTVEFDTFPTMTIPQLKRELRAVKIKYSKNESKESLLAKLMAQFE